jgi:hypothetical protein
VFPAVFFTGFSAASGGSVVELIKKKYLALMNTHFTINDLLGFTGVAILLAAYLLHQLNKLSKDGLTYILMNITGAGLACFASYLIRYLPFIILEATWMMVSVVALVKELSEKKTV